MEKNIQQSSYNVIHRDFKQASRDQVQSDSKPSTSPVVWRQKSILASAIIVVAIALSLTLLVQISNNFLQVQKLDQQIVVVQGEQQAAQAEQESLSVQVQLLQNDEYITKLARSEYYLSKKGEIIFSLPEDFTGTTSNE